MTMESEKFNQPERRDSMKTEEIFELTPEQEPISFTPVGGDLEKIGIDSKEKLVLFPPEEQQEISKTITVSFFIPEKGKPINREAIERWCKENGWRLATGFELASLYEKLWKDYNEKKIDERELNEKLYSLRSAVAIGDSCKGNYVATSKPNWDYSLTLFSPQELNDNFRFAIVKL
ncbi:MAG: hypothetical protein CO014_02330 [Candidatus Tagabacteria bacterium CG_4_8_14_3_um_filter_41_8]|uniref:Uncharacterized protein n=1 Tax=Candidatus Tagabacteria bacterium CG_4_8_14_3_um_filter_41_8 TaxID=1975018 RepID=A0A2M8G8E3_9BACT|nr:MAG: hypothetical protein CO014_02330 [Candidatus Tagabacteria bacterium CG_4_8_14_3_um_filter_41_8]